MAKPTPIPSYRFGDVELIEADTFIYEVNLYRIFVDRVECLSSQHFSAEKPIKKFQECTTKKTKSGLYMRSIEWVAAPMSYMERNGFKLYDKTVNKKQKKKLL